MKEKAKAVQMNRKTSFLFGIAVALTATLVVWTAGGDLPRLNLWVCIVGPLLGVMIGIYGGIAGSLLRRGRARRPVMAIGLFFLAACLGMAVGGVTTFLMGRPWMFAVPWLIVGGLAGLIFAPLLWDLRRRYDKAESQRLAAPDPSRVDGLRMKASAVPGLVLAVAIWLFIGSAILWEKKAGPEIVRWAWLPSALAGVVGGMYGDIAWRLARKGSARRPVMAAGAVLFLASVGMVVAALVMFLAGRPYEYCWPWLVPGAVGSYVFAWALWRLRRGYEGAEMLRVQARDVYLGSDVIWPLARGIIFLVFIGVLFRGHYLWGTGVPESVQQELLLVGTPAAAAFIYYAIALRLAHRARARRSVLGLGALLLAASGVALVGGVALFMAGRVAEVCLTWLLVGVSGSVMFSGALMVVGQRYHESETRRLQAEDISST
ncbi:MAG: hypothetical protein JSV79_02445 [Armatimonadota bacterium]|nr:MAG: hypothetical protein JSV79_02445 [Armatimonadota bacterium]